MISVIRQYFLRSRQRVCQRIICAKLGCSTIAADYSSLPVNGKGIKIVVVEYGQAFGIVIYVIAFLCFRVKAMYSFLAAEPYFVFFQIFGHIVLMDKVRSKSGAVLIVVAVVDE